MPRPTRSFIRAARPRGVLRRRGLSGTCAWRSPRGSVLLEVVVATLLVGLLVGPLATTFNSAVERARAARGASVEVSPSHRPPTPSQSWEWGARVISGWWRPGPLLHLRLAEGEGLQVGLWVDGWLVADELAGDAAAANGELVVGPELWNGLEGRELVVRVRERKGVWGPPWRLVVPGAAAAAPPAALMSSAPAGDDAVVIHRPAAGTSPLTVGRGPTVIDPLDPGSLFTLSPVSAGRGAVTLEGRWQWWWGEGGRIVDVYF